MEARTEHPGARALSGEPERVVGIDLGTTNSALAWSDPHRAIQLFEIPQLIAPNETARQASLPSFLYFPTESDRQTGAMRLPWNAQPDVIAGVLAREHGALVPGRQIASAKSWLSNGLVDRTAALLPWAISEGPKLSPVDASARLLMHLREAFHGRTGYTISMTNTADPRKTQYFPKFDWPRITNPKIQFPATEESLAAAARAEADALQEAKKYLQERKDDIAAFIMEPIQGEGGDNHFRPEFFRAMRQLCDENDMLLIFDEVQTGVGMTGKMWSFQHFGVEPDIFAFGKKTQVCGFAANDRIFDIDENVFTVSSRINSTWGGNLTDMVRSQRYFEIIDEEKLVSNAATVGDYFQKGLHRLAEQFPELITNVRGRGLMIAFDLPAGDVRDNAIKAMEANDLLVLSSGHRSVRFRPPLNLSTDEADEGIRRMEKSLQQIS